MNPLSLILCAALAGLLLVLAAVGVQTFRRSLLISAINVISPGTSSRHESGRITYKAAAALVSQVATVNAAGQRFLLVKRGADDDTVTVAAAATDLTRGVCTDAPTTALEPVNVDLHGGAGETRLVYLAVDAAQDAELVPHTTGGAQPLQGLGAGTYYPFGRAARAGVAGDIIEYVPVTPTPRVV